jgi:hypothetical protein
MLFAGRVPAAYPYTPFIITVTDAETGESVPLVELTTVNKIVYETDAHGKIAFFEPGLMDVGDVYFRITAPHGYEALETDFFGYRGKTFRPTANGSAQLSLKPKADAGVRPEYSKRQRFRLRHPHNTTPGTYAPFTITVRDAATGRGVPLVELRTADELSWYTDSAGRIAFYEPALMDKEVFFQVHSYGYLPPAGGGVRLKTTADGSTDVKIRRVNMAERLYRITGEGIYHDSVLLEESIPFSDPLPAGKVVGQDTVAMTEYKGRLFWLWGDTERPAYPLGNFKTSSAVSLLPGKGGLDPDVGVKLEYFVGKDGFSKPMFPHPKANLVWMGTLAAVDDKGTERLVASYSAMDGNEKVFESGIAVFNDAAETFETLVKFGPEHHVRPSDQAFEKDGYVYINWPYPTIRIRADLAAFKHPERYEAYTPLVTGTGFDGEKTRLERDEANRLVWDWKPNTAPLNDNRWQSLVKANRVTEAEAHNRIRDTKTGQIVSVHRGSAAYNAYKDCWIMIFNQQFGESFLGEIWISAAPAPEGPWTKARKIVTHHAPDSVYTFYNAAHHPVFDQDGGRRIYFEGTYVTTYSGNPTPTPRYDYNQIMYGLDLDDLRLAAIWPRK